MGMPISSYDSFSESAFNSVRRSAARDVRSRSPETAGARQVTAVLVTLVTRHGVAHTVTAVGDTVSNLPPAMVRVVPARPAEIGPMLLNIPKNSITDHFT